jgi:hypothetical protein
MTDRCMIKLHTRAKPWLLYIHTQIHIGKTLHCVLAQLAGPAAGSDPCFMLYIHSCIVYCDFMLIQLIPADQIAACSGKFSSERHKQQAASPSFSCTARAATEAWTKTGYTICICVAIIGRRI